MRLGPVGSHPMALLQGENRKEIAAAVGASEKRLDKRTISSRLRPTGDCAAPARPSPTTRGGRQEQG